MAGFARRLADAAAQNAEKTIVIVLDNLDAHADEEERLDERSGVLAWLPTELPTNVRLLASVAENGRAHLQVKDALAASAFLHLEGFSDTEAMALLDSRLKQRGRQLR